MPAYFDSGFFKRVPAWHNLGIVTYDHVADWARAWDLATAGKPWDIMTESIHDPFGEPIVGWKAVRRSDSGALLHVATESYEPIMMREYGSLVDEVRAAFSGKLEYETTVVLHGGKRIASTLAIPSEVWNVEGDSAILPYVNFMTSHDETVAWKSGTSNVRIVCANTLSLAQSEMDARGSSLVLRHTLNWRSRVPDIISGISDQIKGISEIRRMAMELAARRTSTSRVDEFIDKWIPVSSDMTARQLSNVMARRAEFLTILESETTQGIAGTAWGLYNAAIEQVDHLSTARSLDTRVDRTLFGGSDARKAVALRHAMSV